MRRFEVTIWDKREHWTFETTIEAQNEREAHTKAAKQYGRRGFSIRRVHPITPLTEE